MKKYMVWFIILVIVLAACAAPPPPTPIPTPIPTNTPVPTETPKPTPTPDPLLFKDEFEGAIGPGWSWVNENAKRWSLESQPGWLEITTGGGGIADGSLENLFLREVPDGNFELETKMRFEPVRNFQIGGLVILESAANFALFGRAFCKPSQVCVGDGFYLDMSYGGGYVPGNFSTPAPDIDTIYLRLRREGGTYTAYTSEDGSAWKLVGAHTSEMVPMFVGLATGQSTSGTVPAQFDYFTVTALY